MYENYSCVTTVKGIQSYIGENSIVAFDFETAPDDPYREDYNAALDSTRAHLVGCSFSVEEGTGIYVPIAHRTGINIDKDAFFEFLGNFLQDKKIIKIAHNIAFESSIAYAMGMVIQSPIYDTICAAQMTLKNRYEFRKLKDCGLKNLSAEIFEESLPAFSQVTEGKHFDELDANDVETVRYGSADADFSLRLYHRLNAWFDHFLPKHRFIVEEIESPSAVYLGIMKYNGVPVNIALMQQKKMEIEREIQAIDNEIGLMTGGIDIGANCSTAALKHYLYKELNLPVFKTTENNQPSLDDMTIVLLKEWCIVNRPEVVPLLSLIQEYRKLAKIKSTYIDGYLRFINPVTRCIHPDIFSLEAATGRMSCCNPNVQNMPRMGKDTVGVRDFIKAPEGNLVLSVDFSQIELRVGAFYCKDETMVNTYRNGGDIHASTTSVIFNIAYDKARDKEAEGYKENRTIAKNVNFGVFFGIFPKGLQRTLKFQAEIEKSIPECETIIRNLKNGYPKIDPWQKMIKENAAKKQYVETYLGRRRYLPGIKSKDWAKKSEAERCALNTPIQGTAADILKLAMARIIKGLPEREWLKPILQIHDELTFIIPAEKLIEATDFIRDCMEARPFSEFDLPLVAEASAGTTFGTMKELEA